MHCAQLGTMVSSLLRRLAIVLAFGVLTAFGTAAHEIRPTIATADVSVPGRIGLTLSLNIEALLAGIGPEHKDTDDAPGAAQYKALRALAAGELNARFRAFAPRWLGDLGIAFDGAPAVLALEGVLVPDTRDQSLARISVVQLSGVIPANALAFRWAYPPRFGTSVLRVKRSDTVELETNWLTDGASRAEVPLRAGAARGWLSTAFEYVAVGFTHILPKGLDHILFVLGLFLLSAQLRPLLVQVTAFTVAHSITLALGLYGVVSLPSTIVEPLIALSIVFVAVENLWAQGLTPWRPFVVFAFGLLHGLGFAGVLQEFGLPATQYAAALVGFNIGVEFGQLAVIALAWFATTYWFGGRSWYRQRIVVPASVIVACFGLFWTVERIWSA